MERQIELRVKVSVLKQRQAQLHSHRREANDRRQAWQLYTEAAENDQIAYRLFVRLNTFADTFDSKRLLEEKSFLTERVRRSSQQLIETNQCHDLSRQLGMALNGLSLVSSTQPHLFFGNARICATYGRTLDELRRLDREAARKCLDKFHMQCIELTRHDRDAERIQGWISDERERIKGKPIQLLGLER